MSTGAMISAEQYLATHYQREPEFVRGELVEKPVPTKKHGRTQYGLCALLGRAGYGCSDVRMKLAGDLYLIPDVALFESEPPGDVPNEPPLLIAEIGSPDDRLQDVEKKLQEYRNWGVANVWFIEPELEKLYVYERGLVNVAQLALPQFNLTITSADLFS